MDEKGARQARKKDNPHKGHRERKRQQFLRYGADPFSDHELLEVLLFYAYGQRDTNPIAHALIDRFGSLAAVLSAPVEELEKVPEVGRSTAVLIALVPALYRKALISAASERAVILDTTQRCGDYFRALFAAQAREVFYQACLDGKGKLLNLYRISEGDVSSVTLNIRTIAENAIRANAVQVVLAHNHPSGIALPSEDDINTTEQAKKALGTVGVRLADHIIVADGDFVSMADSGYLEGY